MSIGCKIKQLRLGLNMSVDELAEKIGKNRATIYRYEKGDIGNLPLDVLEPLANALEVEKGMKYHIEPFIIKIKLKAP